jgi:purine-nucleoside phosphorylase
VLGTGLGRMADDLEDARSLPYAEVPHFPKVGVSGHGGQIISGRLDGKRVLIFQGRAHFYETGDPAVMRVPIGVVQAFNGPPLLLTNAAGSAKLDLRPGSLVLLTDHINFAGVNPLLGDTSEGRFVSMVGAYDERLRRRMKLAGIASGITLNEGVYYVVFRAELRNARGDPHGAHPRRRPRRHVHRARGDPRPLPRAAGGRGLRGDQSGGRDRHRRNLA